MDGFIVMWDDGCGYSALLGWDAKCEGAICCGDTVAMFPTRKAARDAIRISTKFYELQVAQRAPIVNGDFSPADRKNLKIIPLVKRKERNGN